MYIKQTRLLLSLLLFLLIAFIPGIQAQDIPEPMSPPRLVNDFARMLSPQEQSNLEEMLRAYNDSTSTQIYVVIVSTFDGYDKSQYATELGEKWKIGQKSKNNGAVLLIKPKSGNERGEVFIAAGYGLEGALPDAVCKRIIEQAIIPYFKQGAYYDGIKNGILRMISYLSGEYTINPNDEGVTGKRVPKIFIIIVIIIVILIVSKSGGGGQSMSSRGIRRSGGGIFFPPSSRGGGFGGFSGGGGGFGGGGGGSFGGGGAGGSW